MELEVGDIVLCTVDRIVGTIVFVKIPLNGKEIEGNLVFSEVAPGRIRNIRDYVVPKKKIICKVLRISGERVDLSLRRVTQKEQKEVREQHKQEKSYKSILKSILKNKTNKIIEEITKKESFYDFLEKAKKDPRELEKIVGKKDSEKILEILNVQKSKKAEIKKEISMKIKEGNGLEKIKEILTQLQNVEVRYISAGKYSLKIKDKDMKSTNAKIKKVIDEIEKSAKKLKAEFSVR